MPAILNAADDVVGTIFEVKKAFEVGTTRWIGAFAHQVNNLLWFNFGASKRSFASANLVKNYGEGVNVAFDCSIDVRVSQQLGCFPEETLQGERESQ